MGDLDEKFRATLTAKSLWRARINYWYQVFNYLRPFAIRSLMMSSFYYSGMMVNYSKIAARNLRKQKLYSTLNIGGLAVGIAAFIMIALFVQYEFSYDRFLPRHQNIYRIYQKQAGNLYLGSEYFAVTPIQLAGVLRDEFPEVEHATIVHAVQSLMKVGKDSFLENGITTDEHFFEVFQFELTAGDPSKVLAHVDDIVLTEKLARKFFPKENPMGKMIDIENGEAKLVTGIVKDPPENSTLRFDYVINIRSNKFHARELTNAKWNNNSYHTFFTLTPGSGVAQLEKKFPDMILRHRDPESYKAYPFKDTYYTQALTDMHLANGINFDIGDKGKMTYVFVFSGIGVMVLLLACINYMNLAIARSISRAREVGLRKVVGAVRKQLVFQFLGESVFITLLSLAIAMGLTVLLLPFFGTLVERTLVLDFSANRWLIPGLLGIVLLVGLTAGSYPAAVISALKPAVVMKGNATGFGSRFTLQRVLTVAQFTISIALITVSIVIYQQMQFIKTKDLGFDKDHVLVINISDRNLQKHFENLQQEWLKNPHILTVAATEHLPSNITSSTVINDEDEDRTNDLNIYHSRITADYFKVFGIRLLTGRPFTDGMKSEYEHKAVINEAAAKALGWTAKEAVGKTFENDHADITVIGVVKNFNMHNLHLSVAPAMFTLFEPDWGIFAMKISPENVNETIAYVEKTVKPLTTYPFHYEFMEDSFNQMYKEDVRVGKTFGFFTGLSLLIAALGLFGLAAFVSGQRTREIGIRKVLGASVNSILLLISADFVKLMVLSFAISIPFAWVAANRWLESFAYRIELSWWMFAAAGLLTALVANAAIGYQSVRASLTDPVQSLKSN